MANFQPASNIEYDGRLLNGTDLLYDTTQGVRIWGNATQDNYSIGDTTTGGVDSTYGNNNLALGTLALSSIQAIGTTKNYNIAIGSEALKTLGTYGNSGGMSRNIAIGLKVAKNAPKLSDNIIIGPYCLETYNSTATTLTNQILIGNWLLRSTTSIGTRNIILGNYSLSSSSLTTVGYDNIVLGNNVATAGTQSVGSSNIVIGNTTLGSSQLSVGSQNILIGNDAGGGGNALPSGLVYIGYNSGVNHTVAGNYFNVMIGSNTGSTSQVDTKYSVLVGTSTNTNGGYSTIIGYNSGPSTASYFNTGYFSYNTILGASSGQTLNSGNNNIIIGTSSGNNLTDGNYNIIIGDSLSAQTATGSNNIDILTNSGTTGIQFTNSSSTLSLKADLVSVPNGRFTITGSIPSDNIPITVNPTINTTTTANIYTYYHYPTLVPSAGNLTGIALGIYLNPRYASNNIPNSASSHYSGMQIVTGATSALTTAIPDVRGLTISFNSSLYAATVAPIEYTHLRLTDPTLTGSTNTYNIYSGSNTATGKWNLYILGSSPNYFASKVLLGSTTDSGTGEILQVTGTALVSSNLKVAGVQINTSTKANTAWLASGTADSTTFLRGDGTWATTSGAASTQSIARTFALMGA